jgi:hypothetical protein
MQVIEILKLVITLIEGAVPVSQSKRTKAQNKKKKKKKERKRKS